MNLRCIETAKRISAVIRPLQNGIAFAGFIQRVTAEVFTSLIPADTAPDIERKKPTFAATSSCGESHSSNSTDLVSDGAKKSPSRQTYSHALDQGTVKARSSGN